MIDPSRVEVAVAKLEDNFRNLGNEVGLIERIGRYLEGEDLSIPAEWPNGISGRSFRRIIFDWGVIINADVELWRYLTPRILREIAEQALFIEETLIARKFCEAQWMTWPEDERLAVREFCEAWFESSLVSESGPSVVTTLPFAAVMFHDVYYWLTIWSGVVGGRADRQLGAMAAWWLPDLITGELDISFSGELPDSASLIADWLVAEAPSRIGGMELKPVDLARLEYLCQKRKVR